MQTTTVPVYQIHQKRPSLFNFDAGGYPLPKCFVITHECCLLRFIGFHLNHFRQGFSVHDSLDVARANESERFSCCWSDDERNFAPRDEYDQVTFARSYYQELFLRHVKIVGILCMRCPTALDFFHVRWKHWCMLANVWVMIPAYNLPKALMMTPQEPFPLSIKLHLLIEPIPLHCVLRNVAKALSNCMQFFDYDCRNSELSWLVFGFLWNDSWTRTTLVPSWGAYCALTVEPRITKRLLGLLLRYMQRQKRSLAIFVSPSNPYTLSRSSSHRRRLQYFMTSMDGAPAGVAFAENTGSSCPMTLRTPLLVSPRDERTKGNAIDRPTRESTDPHVHLGRVSKSLVSRSGTISPQKAVQRDKPSTVPHSAQPDTASAQSATKALESRKHRRAAARLLVISMALPPFTNMTVVSVASPQT
ncbi:hypothetical protein KC331_g8 [Hortaea werneckii]|nr:hypothetical protein KC331_g8 [Hortaea werneckii]